MQDRDEIKAALLASARKELTAHRMQQRVLAELHLSSRVKLDCAKNEIAKLKELEQLLNCNRVEICNLLDIATADQVSCFPTLMDVERQLSDASAEGDRWTSAEGTVQDEKISLQRDVAAAQKILETEKLTLESRITEQELFASLRLEAKHQDSLAKMIADETVKLQREETRLTLELSEVEAHIDALRAATLTSCSIETTSSVLAATRCAVEENSPVASETAVDSLQMEKIAAAVAQSQRRISWLEKSLPRPIFELQQELSGACDALRSDHEDCVVLRKCSQLKEEISLTASVCNSTSQLAEEEERAASRLPTISSLAETVESRIHQVERLEVEVELAQDDLSMLEDKKATDRCQELSHAIKSYVLVSIPSAKESVREKLAELHELKLATHQWPGESERHVAHITTLQREHIFLEGTLGILDASRSRAVSKKQERQSCRHLWAQIVKEIPKSVQLETARNETICAGSDDGAAIFDGGEIRYVPLPPARNVTFITGANSPQYDQYSFSTRRKTHFNFLAVTLVNKLAQLVGRSAGHERLISLSL